MISPGDLVRLPSNYPLGMSVYPKRTGEMNNVPNGLSCPV